MKILFLTLSLLCIYSINAQAPKDYAQKVVEVLSSSDLAGRGYVDNGLQKAENEIVSQFQKIGLQKFNGSYLQNVSYPINIIEDCSLMINGEELEFGADYLVSGYSKTGSGKLRAQYFNTNAIDSAFIKQEVDDIFNEAEMLKGGAVIFPTAMFPLHLVSDGYLANDLYREVKQGFFQNEIGENKVFLEMTKDKLTMGLSAEARDNYVFTVSEEKIKSKIASVEYSVQSSFNPNFSTNNIIGYIPGKDSRKKIIVSAHYDHLGKIGDHYFPGANDNASGIALLLSLARYYTMNTPNYTMVFVAFTGEEAGLKGSQYFVENPPFDLKDVQLVCNFDIVGTGNEGVQIVNSVKEAGIYNSLVRINQKHQLLPNIKKRDQACNSDHCPFEEKGIRNIYTYTLGGNPYYHDINDTADNLSLAKFNEVFELYTFFFNEFR